MPDSTFEDDLFSRVMPEIDQEFEETDLTAETASSPSEETLEATSSANEPTDTPVSDPATNKPAPTPSASAEPQPKTDASTDEPSEDTRPVTTTASGISYSAQGHVVDREGNIIAHSGHERRLYERAHTTQQYVEQQQQELNNYRQAWEIVEPFVRQINETNLSPEEMGKALDMYKQYRDNPIETAQYLLAQLQQMGYDPNGGNVPAISPGSIRDMIRAEMRSAMNQPPPSPPQQNRQASNDAAATAELRRVYQQFPDATMHETELRTLMTKYNFDGPTAYAQLINWAKAQNINLDLPIVPQIQARQRNQNPATQRPATPTRPMPSGRGTVTQVPLGNPVDRVEPADTSYDAIIRDVMKQSGM